MNAPGEGMMNEMLSPLAKTDLSRARVNCMLDIRLTWEGVGVPMTLKNLGALQL
jgi:hypothetical protein